MDKKEFIPIGPFRGWVLQNFPFIEADFDAITNYQLWCKVVEYINKIAYNEELLEDSNDELIDAFNNLKTYVETYLENLDVEGYVDNKLDEMAESGQLQEIMESYVQVEGILAYNTLSNLKDADNLVEGSFTKIYGKITYNDGLGCFYKIRLKTTEDIIDENNIISLTNYSDLVGEKMTNKDIQDINYEITDINDNIDDIKDDILDINDAIDDINDELNNKITVEEETISNLTLNGSACIYEELSSTTKSGYTLIDISVSLTGPGNGYILASAKNNGLITLLNTSTTQRTGISIVAKKIFLKN